MNKKTKKSFALLALVCILALLAGCTASVEVKPKMEEVEVIPRTKIFGNPERANPNISPDGKLVGFLAPVEGVMNLWVGPSDDISKAKPITNDKGRGIMYFYFAYTNKHVLFAQDKNGNENYHIYCVNLDDGKVKDLTPEEKSKAYVYSTSEKFPEKIVLYVNLRNEAYFDLILYDIITGEKKMLYQNDEYTQFNIDYDYNVRFMYKEDDEGNTFIYTPNPNGKPELFDTLSFEDSFGSGFLYFDKTGENVYLTDSRGRDTSGLYLVNLKTKEKKLLAENEKSDFTDLAIHPTEKNLQAVAFTYEKMEWTVLDDAVKPDFEYLLSQCDGEMEITSRTQADDKWMVHFKNDNKPSTYYVFDRAKKELTKLFTTRPELENYKLAKMHPVIIKAKDGMDLVCYYTLPPWADAKVDGKPDNPLPMIVNVHGGPWYRDFWGYDPTHQWFANRGYAVLSVNYRGSFGFGKNYLNAGNGEWAGKMHQDVLDATDWAIAEGIADPKKVCIFGGSYGGYEALVGITFTPDKFACAVDIVGIANLTTFLNTVPAYWKTMFARWTKGIGGDPTTQEGKKILKEKSPITYVDKIMTPLLIGHGQNDPRVKVSESEQIVSVMKSKNIPVTYALFPDEGHGFRKPENKISFFAVVEKFVAKFLGGRFEDIGEAMKGSSITVPEGSELIEGLKEALPKPKEP